jgi:hypothetical protein
MVRFFQVWYGEFWCFEEVGGVMGFWLEVGIRRKNWFYEVKCFFRKSNADRCFW